MKAGWDLGGKWLWHDLWPKDLHPQDGARGAVAHLGLTTLMPPGAGTHCTWEEGRGGCTPGYLIPRLSQCFKKNRWLIPKAGVWLPEAQEVRDERQAHPLY